MEFRQLRSFVEVVRQGSFTQAAQVRHASQSTISKQVAQLEQSLGVQVLERNGPHVRLTEYASWDAFLEGRAPREDQLFLFEEFGAKSFYEPDYPEDAFLVFGQETKGIPQAIIARHEGRLFKLPMRSEVIRSLNLANTVTAAAYQALRGKLD